MSSNMKFDQALDMPESLSTDAFKVFLMPERVRYNVRIKPSDLVAAKKTSGLKFPSKIGASEMAKDQVILCLGPDEWLIIADPAAGDKVPKALETLQSKFTVSVTDISHRNIGFGLMGPQSVSAINVGCPLDLSLEAFPVGKTTRTVFESVPIILTRTGQDHFGIECWRSFAPYMRDFFVRIVAT